MKRSIGVTLSAIVSLLGSALTLGLGVLVIFLLFFFAPTRANFSGVSSAPKAIFVMGVLVYVLPAIWGIITSIGLFCLKNWARISIIIFSVILILMGALVGVIMLLMPFPAAPAGAATQSTMTGIRLGMGGFWFGIAGIGIWWLILFTRPKVKAQFAAPSPAYPTGAGLQPAASPLIAQSPSSARPLSITIIAWLLLVGCAFFPLNFVIHAPAIFLSIPRIRADRHASCLLPAATFLTHSGRLSLHSLRQSFLFLEWKPSAATSIGSGPVSSRQSSWNGSSQQDSSAENKKQLPNFAGRGGAGMRRRTEGLRD